MPLALSFFTAFLVYGAASPYLPILVRGLGYSPAVVGFLLGLFEVAGIAGPFLIGRMADRFGRYRPSLAASFGLVIVSLLPLSQLRNPVLSALFLTVLAVGLKSIIPLLDAVATLRIGPQGNYGRVRSAGSVSFVLMAVFLQYQPWFKVDGSSAVAFWIALPSVLALLALPILPDQSPRGYRSSQPGPQATGARSKRFLTDSFILGIAMIALGRLAMSPISSFFSLFVVEELHWDAVGLLWAIAAAAEIPFMFVSARLIARFGAVNLLGVSVLAVAARLAIYALFPNPAGAVCGQLLHSLAYGVFHPAAVSFVSARVPPERRVTGMAIYLSLGVGLPTFIGSSAGGLIVEAAGYRVLFASYIVFAAASFVLFLSKRSVLEKNAPAA